MEIDIIQSKAIQSDLMELWKTGGGKVYDLGFKSLRGAYGIMRGTCTDWSGFPVSGKTELVYEIAVIMTEFYGWKHLIYMPDAGSAAEIVSDLIEKFSKKTFKNFYYDRDGNKVECLNRITEKEIYKWEPHVMHYFNILTKKNISKRFTPKEIWDYAAKNKEELEIDDVIVDSWNYLKHNTEGHARSDIWLEDVLSYRNQLAQESGLHFHTIVHPKSDKKTKDGKIPLPTEHDLKGGSEWFNNAKNLGIAHRVDKDAKSTDISFPKRKRMPGHYKNSATLFFDMPTRRYYELDDISGTKHFATKLEDGGFEL